MAACVAIVAAAERSPRRWRRRATVVDRTGGGVLGRSMMRARHQRGADGCGQKRQQKPTTGDA